MLRERATPHLLFSVGCTLIIAALQYYGRLAPVEVPLQDAFMRVAAKPPADRELVFLAIDTASVSLDPGPDLEEFLHVDRADPDAARALRLMAHAWPWSREIHALVLDRLVAAGARAVVFDLNFPKPSLNDEPFAAALEKYRERVALVGNITDAASGEGTQEAFSPPTPTLIPSTPSRDPRVGYDNFFADFDGVVRRAQYRRVISHGIDRGPEEFSLAARAAQHLGRADAIPAGSGQHRIKFAGPAGTFPPRSIYEIFAPDYWRQNFANGDFFRGKVVVIGAQGNWQHDEHDTPMGGKMPGAEIHLHAINALLGSHFAHELPLGGEVALVLFAGALPFGIRRFVQRPGWRFGALLLAIAGCALGAFATYQLTDCFIPSIAPALALALNGISGLARDVFLERQEKGKMRRTLARYMSKNVVEELLDHPEEYMRTLGGEVRPVTILFSDIRNFTGFAGSVDPMTLVTQLNEYFSEMVECVFRFGGSLDKFIGDALMAVWGNTGRTPPETDARNAVLCALAMRDALVQLNARWKTEGRPELRMGIGINAGDAIVGNIGSPSRMEFTVIGDPVNAAWRIQDATKRLGTDLLLGEAVIRQLGPEFPTEGETTVVVSGGLTVQCARLAEAPSEFTGSRTLPDPLPAGAGAP